MIRALLCHSNCQTPELVNKNLEIFLEKAIRDTFFLEDMI